MVEGASFGGSQTFDDGIFLQIILSVPILLRCSVFVPA